MFGLFKKKLKDVIDKFSKKTEEEVKEEPQAEEVKEEPKEEIKEEKPKRILGLFKKKEKKEEVKEKIEEEKPETEAKSTCPISRYMSDIADNLTDLDSIVSPPPYFNIIKK